jgi:hypothetical protein
MSPLFFPGGREEEARYYTDQVQRLLHAGLLTPGEAPKHDRDGTAALVRQLAPAAKVYADGPRGATAYCLSVEDARALVTTISLETDLHWRIAGIMVRVRR